MPLSDFFRGSILGADRLSFSRDSYIHWLWARGESTVDVDRQLQGGLSFQNPSGLFNITQLAGGQASLRHIRASLKVVVKTQWLLKRDNKSILNGPTLPCLHM